MFCLWKVFSVSVLLCPLVSAGSDALGTCESSQQEGCDEVSLLQATKTVNHRSEKDGPQAEKEAPQESWQPLPVNAAGPPPEEMMGFGDDRSRPASRDDDDGGDERRRRRRRRKDHKDPVLHAVKHKWKDELHAMKHAWSKQVDKTEEWYVKKKIAEEKEYKREQMFLHDFIERDTHRDVQAMKAHSKMVDAMIHGSQKADDALIYPHLFQTSRTVNLAQPSEEADDLKSEQGEDLMSEGGMKEDSDPVGDARKKGFKKQLKAQEKSWKSQVKAGRKLYQKRAKAMKNAREKHEEALAKSITRQSDRSTAAIEAHGKEVAAVIKAKSDFDAAAINP